MEIKYEGKEKDKYYEYSFPGGDHATSVVEGVGMGLFALYHVVIIIVLINMLIAMMSHSFEDIQVSKHNSILSFRRLYCHIHAPRAFAGFQIVCGFNQQNNICLLRLHMINPQWNKNN